jgi:hypothetical protein
MAGKKTFVAGEVLLAQDVNDYLMDQSVMNFATSAARSSAIPTPTEGMVSYLADIDNLQLYNGTSWLGVSGILQVLSTAKTNTFTTTSATFTDVTGLTVSITPRSTSSKILVMAQVAVGFANAVSNGHFALAGGNTASYVGDAASNRIRGVFGGFNNANLAPNLMGLSLMYLDSPATTSATTYSVQCRRGAAGTVYVNRSEQDTDSADIGRGASSITVMEVAG